MAVRSIYDILGLKAPALTNPDGTPRTSGGTTPSTTPGTSPATTGGASAPLPTIQPGQMAQLAPVPAQSQNQMISATQTAAQAAQNTSPTAAMTSQLAQQYLQNPNLGFNPQTYVQENMDTDARARAGALDAWNQKTAEQANLGARNRQFEQLALQSAMERGDLEKTLNTDAINQSRDNLVKALTTGQDVAGMENTINTSKVQNLVSATGVGEGEAQRSWQTTESSLGRVQELLLQSNDIQGQKDITELQGKIKSGQMLNEQDFTAAQAVLDRELTTATNTGNWANAIELTNLKATLDAEAATAARTWQSAERLASQSWQTTERLSTQDYDKGMAYIDQQYALALQKNDIDSQEKLATQKNQLDLTMQTNAMMFDEKMTYLADDLLTAQKNGDVGRQEDIMDYQAKIQFTEDERQQGYAVALANLQGSVQEKLAAGEYAQAAIMQQNQFEFQAYQAVLDRQVEMTTIALQEKGLDMQLIQDAVANGQVSPEDALTALNALIADRGIVLSAPDPEAYKGAIDNAVDSAQYLYGQERGLLDPATGKLTDEGLKQYQDYVQTGEGEQSQKDLIASIISGVETAASLKGKDYSDATYKGVLDAATPSTSLSIVRAGTGFLGAGDTSYTLQDVPKPGGFIKVGTVLYKVDSGPVNLNGDHIDTNYYYVIDVTTGARKLLTPVTYNQKLDSANYSGAKIVDSASQIDTQ